MAAQSVSSSIERIADIARALGDLSGQVVFIGGAIAPLLQTNPPFPRVRATKDVDAVVVSTNYSDYGALQARLQESGFKVGMSGPKHAHRWRSPDGKPFDLVPVGDHLGGTGGQWGKMALQTATEREIEPGLRIRHASAPGFLALKWAAFWDRGANDPFSSHDLEDILALTVSRDTVVEECRSAPEHIQEAVRKGFGWLMANPDYDDLVAAHLANAQAFKEVAALLRDRISQISATSVNK